MSFNEGVTIIVGPNACGKTTVLEGIGVLGTTRSFKGAKDSDLISFGEKNYYIQSIVENEESLYKIGVLFSNEGKRVFKNDNFLNRLSDYIDCLNVVTFSSFDFKLVIGSPMMRRNFLNLLAVQLKKGDAQVFNDYNKILKERNFLLKKSNSLLAEKDAKLLDILTTQLIDKGKKIIQIRSKTIDLLNEYLGIKFEQLVGIENSKLRIQYVPNITVSNYDSIMKENVKEDFNKGTTGFGPHKDDFVFLLNDKNLESHGSQGQQRDALVSLKLAMVHVINDEKNTWPVLLLDDVFSELDPVRQNNVLTSIDKNVQTIITTTSLSDIEERILSCAHVVKL